MSFILFVIIYFQEHTYMFLSFSCPYQFTSPTFFLSLLIVFAYPVPISFAT